MEIRNVESIVRALNAAQVDYLIVGGLAVNAYGFVRLTRDVEIVIRLTLSDEHRRTPIDIFVYEPFALEPELARSLRLELLLGVTAPVVALDTLLAMKRTAGCPQDLLDIIELERVQ